MTIEAEIYGETPNANIENLCNEPPVIIFAKSPKFIFFSDTLGTGIVVPTIKMNKHNNVNPNLFLIS